MPTRKTTEDFIEASKSKHGDKYDYSRVVYVNNKTPVEIGCKKGHGYFWQNPKNHVRGSNCPKCKIEDHIKRSRKTTKDFIAQAEKLHGGKYDYSETEYVNAHQKVKIICKKGHGAFWQSPHHHLKEKGCPSCALEKAGWGGTGYYKTESPAYFYFIHIEVSNDKFLKVGLSKNTDDRFRRLCNQIEGCKLTPFAVWEGPAVLLYKKVEVPVLFHSGIPRLVRKDWDWHGRTECFDISYKQQLEHFLTETLSPLENVERIL